MYAMAGKENPYHFEIYLASADGENALLSVYNTAVGNAIEGLSGLKSDTLYHIAITYNGQLLTAYVNGQLAAEMKLNLDLDGMGSGEDSIALGSLVDGTLYQSGFLDEVILADYVLDKDLIVKLAEKPEEARAEIELLVKNNYPEGYIKTETSKPTEAPAGESAKPNETAAVGTSAEKTPLLTPTKAPLRTGGSQDISLALIIVIIVSAVVIIAAAALIAVKKIKENKKK